MNLLRHVRGSTRVAVFHHPAPPPLPQLTVREVEWQEVSSLARGYPGYFGTHYRGLLARRWERGGRLHEFRADGDVHFAWLVRRSTIAPTETPGCVIEFLSPIGEIGHCWTPPECRGHGIYTAALRWLARTAAGRGLEPWVYCLDDNAPSLRAIAHAGFEMRAMFCSTAIFAGGNRRRSITLYP